MTNSSQQQDDFEKRDNRHAGSDMAAGQPAQQCANG
ncbi:hypothetical protein HDE76_001584 [Rhodanobacter sp. ANJX3]|nr:hypothetical protein [Rhodanobacter sp. ANJX3]NYE27860.1 hypothetical protein [Rhodanobacter sp. K2T2]